MAPEPASEALSGCKEPCSRPVGPGVLTGVGRRARACGERRGLVPWRRCVLKPGCGQTPRVWPAGHCGRRGRGWRAREVCSARQVVRPVRRSRVLDRLFPTGRCLGLAGWRCGDWAGGCPRWGQPGDGSAECPSAAGSGLRGPGRVMAGWAVGGGRSRGGAARATGVVLVLARTSRGRAGVAWWRLRGTAECPVRGARLAEGRWLPVRRPLSSGRLVSPCRCPPSAVAVRRPARCTGRNAAERFSSRSGTQRGCAPRPWPGQWPGGRAPVRVE